VWPAAERHVLFERTESELDGDQQHMLMQVYCVSPRRIGYSKATTNMEIVAKVAEQHRRIAMGVRERLNRELTCDIICLMPGLANECATVSIGRTGEVL